MFPLSHYLHKIDTVEVIRTFKAEDCHPAVLMITDETAGDTVIVRMPKALNTELWIDVKPCAATRRYKIVRRDRSAPFVLLHRSSLSCDAAAPQARDFINALLNNHRNLLDQIDTRAVKLLERTKELL